MPDREKVVKKAEHIIRSIVDRDMIDSFCKDVIALLKEQETTSTTESRIFHCKKCDYGIADIYLSNESDFDIRPHYCPNCGKLVKWGK